MKCYGFDETIMERIINTYYKKVKHLPDERIRASFLLELMTVEKDAILGFQDNDKHYDTLDEALDRFYRLKEYKYTKNLLENYILTGSFDLGNEKQDIVHRLDNFRRITNTLESLFPCLAVTEKKN